MKPNRTSSGLEQMEAMAGDLDPLAAERAWSDTEKALGAEPAGRGRPLFPWVGMAAGILAALLYVDPGSDQRSKGELVLQPELEVLVGAEGPRGREIRRRFVGEGILSPDERALFRVRLRGSAEAALVVRSARGAEVAWRSAGLLPPGEHEVSDADSALALDPNGYSGTIEIVLVTTAGPLDDQELERASRGEEACECGRSSAILELRLP